MRTESGSYGGLYPSDAVNTVPINNCSIEQIRIPTAAAHAVTVTGIEVDENLDLASLNADITGLVPVEIKRRDKTSTGLSPGSVVKGYRSEKTSAWPARARRTAPCKSA